MSILVVDGVVKNYAWGQVDGLVPWCPPSGEPQAEFWFGAHPGGPSPIADDPQRTLADIDGLEDLPLVKLLAAAEPLSIQVHPDADRAAAGFDGQTADGPQLFADPHEKSEIVIALTPFQAHAGWRNPAEAADLFARAGASPELVALITASPRHVAVQSVLALDPQSQQEISGRIVGAAIDAHWPPAAVSALAKIVSSYPDDPGALVVPLLQHHTLEPGEALAVPAGVVHSYIDGLAIEVMTSSDNVLRLGLTAKPIAIPEAVAAIRTDREPVVLPSAQAYRPEGMPFTVEMIDAPEEPRDVTLAQGVARVILCLEGEVRVQACVARPGQAVVVSADESATNAVVGGRAVLVTAEGSR